MLKKEQSMLKKKEEMLKKRTTDAGAMNMARNFWKNTTQMLKKRTDAEKKDRWRMDKWDLQHHQAVSELLLAVDKYNVLGLLDACFQNENNNELFLVFWICREFDVRCRNLIAKRLIEGEFKTHSTNPSNL
jgi:hypothetical protein